MKKIISIALIIFIPFLLSAQIDLGGIVKRKSEERASKKAGEAVDKGLDKVEEGGKNTKKKDQENTPSEKEQPSNGSSSASGQSPAPGNSSAGAAYKVYNNYDFVPGEKIVFEDNFMNDQDGEFPSHWDLVSGQGVVNKMNDKMVFALTEGNYGKIKPVMKSENYLADPFTLEFDFMIKDGSYNPQTFFSAEGDNGRYISWGQNVTTGYFDPGLSAAYPGNRDNFNNTWHHAALAYKNGQMKCYVDQYRVLVIPKCGFVPESIQFGGIGGLESPLIFTNVKVSLGGGMNMLNKILTDGKFMTHAITFDVNKSTIKPESMGFLNQLSKFLNENAAVKLEIDGHTDSDGDDASNLKLSKERAEAVRSQLVSMGIDASRLTTKGLGETKPVSDNATMEGKANNRRVELIKI